MIKETAYTDIKNSYFNSEYKRCCDLSKSYFTTVKQIDIDTTEVKDQVLLDTEEDILEYWVTSCVLLRDQIQFEKIKRLISKYDGNRLKTLLLSLNLVKMKEETKKEKNWDKFIKEEEKKAIRNKEFDCDPSMHFFKEIFKNADEDTKRAMMKSYTTSNGKALSTNWTEVKDKDYNELK